MDSQIRKRLLDVHWFRDLDEVRSQAEKWCRVYNTIKRHGSLNKQTPEEFAAHCRLRSATTSFTGNEPKPTPTLVELTWQVLQMMGQRHYRSLIERYFPKARIVADRFHVIRLIQHHFMDLCRQIAPFIRHRRGWHAALRKHPERLTPLQSLRLKQLFSQYPALKPIHDQMQRLCHLMRKRHQKAWQCRQLAPQLLDIISQLAHSGFNPLVTLANTLRDWQEQIACMWRFTKNNGITEGFHRKMKLIGAVPTASETSTTTACVSSPNADDPSTTPNP